MLQATSFKNGLAQLLALMAGLLLAGCPSTDSPKNTPVDNSAPEALPVRPDVQPPLVQSAANPPQFMPEGLTATDYPHLHNLLRVTDRIYSGSEPHDEAAFAELARLGVKTIVSVDGAIPDVATAEKHGLKYVHIPIGYDGVPEQAGLALTRVAREAGGPVYVHCHHGTHRGPAAAAVVCIASGAANGQAALKILEKAGTSKDYAGLWRDVLKFTPPAPEVRLPELVPIAKVDSLAAAMAKIDRASDNLKLSQAANWQAIADHPDISARQEAVLLKEGLRESLRLLADMQDDRFRQWMTESEQSAAQLEEQLAAGDVAKAKEAFAALQSQCKRCHVEYRNK